MEKTGKIYIAGHSGLVGSSILRNLKKKGYDNLIFKTHSELELENSEAVKEFFSHEKPDYVFLCAAKVGGIHANNKYRADFIFSNLQIQANIIKESWINNVKKLLFLGSSCVYPRDCRQPIKEDYLLTSELEYTNEPYAIAKIAGIKLCESFNIQHNTNFISVMPTNLYGPNDNYDFENSHVLPALIRKIHLAHLLEEDKWEDAIKNLKVNSKNEAEGILSSLNITRDYVEIWGSGAPRREFLHVDDLAEACVWIMNNINFSDLIDKKEIRNNHINIGTGEDLTIKELSEMIADVIGFKGKFIFNSNRPDGTTLKKLDVSKINNLGWKHSIQLKSGIEKTYLEYYREQLK